MWFLLDSRHVIVKPISFCFCANVPLRWRNHFSVQSSKSINVTHTHTARLNFTLSWFAVITLRLMCLSLFLKVFIMFLIFLLRYFCLKKCLLWSQSCWTVIYCYCTYFVSNGLFVGQMCVALVISWRGKLSQDCVSGRSPQKKTSQCDWRHHACTTV